jgi:hypothetical protein
MRARCPPELKDRTHAKSYRQIRRAGSKWCETCYQVAIDGRRQTWVVFSPTPRRRAGKFYVAVERHARLHFPRWEYWDGESWKPDPGLGKQQVPIDEFELLYRAGGFRSRWEAVAQLQTLMAMEVLSR